ncbi:MAG: hypothetical protein AB7V77_00310 [Candidatus Woesearchaeota archaeon]
MKYIALEGIDGTGKSTQVSIQKNIFQEKNINLSIYNYSDKNNFFGQLIKKVYKINSKGIFSGLFNPRMIQETLYALSARANLSPNVFKNDFVISDRSIITAYASHLGILPEWYIDLLEPNFVPDFAIYIDIDPVEAMERLQIRQNLLRDENYSDLVEFRKAYKRIIYEKRPKKLKNVEFIEMRSVDDLNENTQQLTSIIEDILKRK